MADADGVLAGGFDVRGRKILRRSHARATATIESDLEIRGSAMGGAACDPRIRIVTALDGRYGDSAHAMLASLAALGRRYPLRLYHEDSLARPDRQRRRTPLSMGTSQQSASAGLHAHEGHGCEVVEYDLHALYPWLASFASMRRGATHRAPPTTCSHSVHR